MNLKYQRKWDNEWN